MQDTEMSPAELRRVCAHSNYNVILNGTTYATRGVKMIPGIQDEWPAMQVEMNDESILPLLTGTMLGPNTESSEIKVVGTGSETHTVYANLTSYVQRSSRITLALTVLHALRNN